MSTTIHAARVLSMSILYSCAALTPNVTDRVPFQCQVWVTEHVP
jgi:hypothetical protein